jgi:WD40 repeat protein
VSISFSKKFAALACSSHVQIIRLDDPGGIVDYCNLPLKSTGRDNFTVTDVVWNARDDGKLAASATNGAIAVFNVDITSGGDKAGRGQQEWDSSDQTSRSVNKLCWHNIDKNILAAACQEGCVKLFDVRLKKGSCQATFSPRADAARDVQFDPYHPNYFASVFENGRYEV